MKTNFTETQLADPTLSRVDTLLRRCVHCGFCTATCPTYVLLGDERDSPRGRIYLMKEMFESGKVTPTTVRHIDRCLTCLSCMTTCPSSVDYMHLVELARVRIEQKGRRPLGTHIARTLLNKVMPYPRRFRLVMWLGWLTRPLHGLLRKLKFKTLSSALALVPPRPPRLKLRKFKGLFKSEDLRVKRVALMLGCVQEVLQPSINRAAIRLLRRHNVEVMVVKDEVCCGALSQQLGKIEEAQRMARHNVDVWSAAMREGRLDAIMTTASGCGTQVKDYGHLLARDHGYAERVRQISFIARDISEFIAEIGLLPPIQWTSLRVAYQSACSLQHGQGVDEEPGRLLEQAGFTVVDVPEGHLCCGSAGTYNILEPDLAARLRDRKLANIASVGPDLIATGNIGCMMQLRTGAAVPVVHTVELLDWATGGPCPKGLEGLKPKVHPVQSLIEMAALETA
jgi:glycolate oxidase iron-sulfur subunit